MVGQDDPLGIVQEIEIWTYEQMVYAEPRICPWEWDAQTLLGFQNTKGSANIGKTTKSYNNQKKKKKKITRRIVDKYLDLASK